jgi:hypothetical protein
LLFVVVLAVTIPFEHLNSLGLPHRLEAVKPPIDISQVKSVTSTCRFIWPILLCLNIEMKEEAPAGKPGFSF